MNEEIHFVSAEMGDEFQRCVSDFRSCSSLAEPPLDGLADDLENELAEYDREGFLKVAFVGEYSAGKSTIISALTGKRDIKISADIATGETATYRWNGIHLVDTPGLYTEREDHDAITYNAIKESDLIVYCLTHSLFDSITIRNFKKLAFDDRYWSKMLLVVNKMSEEAGEEDEKKRSYRTSLKEALRPESLDRFSVNYIDALDFLDGSDEDDKELIELSSFEEFINSLNGFVEKK